MKIRLKVGEDVFEAETTPIPPERFKIVCRLVSAAIGGVVLLGAIHMVGTSAVIGAAGMLFLVGLYKLMKDF